MNRKIATSCIALVVLCVTIFIIVLMISYNGGEQPDVAAPTIGSNQSVSSPSVTPSPTPQGQGQDRELHFDNRVTVIKTEDSYVESMGDIDSEQGYDGDMVNPYDFSNGFVLSKTDNIDITEFGFDRGEMIGASGALIYVKEENSLNTTIQKLREELLDSSGYSLYLGYDPLGIPVGTDCDITVGFEDYEDYYEGQPSFDPAHTEYGQLLCDDIVNTAFGPALYIEIYTGFNESYNAYAFILCERDRILSISMTDSTREYLWSYLIELTNDGITLVK